MRPREIPKVSLSLLREVLALRWGQGFQHLCLYFAFVLLRPDLCVPRAQTQSTFAAPMAPLRSVPRGGAELVPPRIQRLRAAR